MIVFNDEYEYEIICDSCFRPIPIGFPKSFSNKGDAFNFAEDLGIYKYKDGYDWRHRCPECKGHINH